MCSISRNSEKKIRSFLLYDSAQNTTCCLRAFSSQMSLGPQWRACRVDASAQWYPLTCAPSDTSSICSAVIGHRGGPPGSALLQQRHSHCSSVDRCPSLGTSTTLSPQETQPPRNCWEPSKHVIVSDPFLFSGTLTYLCHIDLLMHES